MKTLGDLLPPLELCRQIPEGAFEDSSLVYCVVGDGRGGERWYLVERRNAGETKYPEMHPAPTLAEILEELPKYDNSGVPLSCTYWVPEDAPKNTPSDTWHVGYKVNNSIWDKSAVTAALKLWLEVSNKE